MGKKASLKWDSTAFASALSTARNKMQQTATTAPTTFTNYKKEIANLLKNNDTESAYNIALLVVAEDRRLQVYEALLVFSENLVQNAANMKSGPAGRVPVHLQTAAATVVYAATRIEPDDPIAKDLKRAKALMAGAYGEAFEQEIEQHREVVVEARVRDAMLQNVPHPLDVGSVLQDVMIEEGINDQKALKKIIRDKVDDATHARAVKEEAQKQAVDFGLDAEDIIVAPPPDDFIRGYYYSKRTHFLHLYLPFSGVALIMGSLLLFHLSEGFSWGQPNPAYERALTSALLAIGLFNCRMGFQTSNEKYKWGPLLNFQIVFFAALALTVNSLSAAGLGNSQTGIQFGLWLGLAIAPLLLRPWNWTANQAGLTLKERNLAHIGANTATVLSVFLPVSAFLPIILGPASFGLDEPWAYLPRSEAYETILPVVTLVIALFALAAALSPHGTNRLFVDFYITYVIFRCIFTTIVVSTDPDNDGSAHVIEAWMYGITAAVCLALKNWSDEDLPAQNRTVMVNEAREYGQDTAESVAVSGV